MFCLLRQRILLHQSSLYPHIHCGSQKSTPAIVCHNKLIRRETSILGVAPTARRSWTHIPDLGSCLETSLSLSYMYKSCSQGRLWEATSCQLNCSNHRDAFFDRFQRPILIQEPQSSWCIWKSRVTSFGASIETFLIFKVSPPPRN